LEFRLASPRRYSARIKAAGEGVVGDMAMKAKRPGRIHQSSPAKKKLFIEGFALLRRLAEGPLSRDEAESELKIPYREWYRWLVVFKECGIPLAEDYRPGRGWKREKTVRLWRQDWLRLIDPKGAPRKRPIAGRRDPTKREIIKAVEGALKSVLR
jgi:hypothetical protein